MSIGFWALVVAVMSFFSGDTVTRDYSKFEVYQFEQTPGLGFCGDPSQPHSAEITLSADGLMAFSYSQLVLVGTDPEQCEEGFATDEGCFLPKDQPSRQLSELETDWVTAVFAETTYHQGPDPMCREYGIDPCMIERHVWDDNELSDFICGSNRLSLEQDTKIRDLLIGLQSGD